MAAKFPAKRPDGTFSIDLLFRSSQMPERVVVEEWLAKWSLENREWTRNWQAAGQIVKTDFMRFSDTYLRPPRVTVLADRDVVIRLDSTSEAPFWKDWLVKLVEETSKNFPNLTFTGAKNAD